MPYRTHKMMQRNQKWKCMRSDNLYNAIVCPAGYFKVNEFDMCSHEMATLYPDCFKPLMSTDF